MTQAQARLMGRRGGERMNGAQLVSLNEQASVTPRNRGVNGSDWMPLEIEQLNAHTSTSEQQLIS